VAFGRRFFLGCMASLPFIRISEAAQDAGRLQKIGEMTFRWKHEGRRLKGEISAPTLGWLAVGFNDRATLKGTRFVIAAVDEAGKLRIDERIAIVPDHTTVAELGGLTGLGDLSGRREGTRTVIGFSLPHTTGDRFPVDLRPHATTHLMLAWSQSADFDHHSTWRRHVSVNL